MQQKSLIKNTIFKSILSIFNILIPLIVGPYIVRILDVELYGAYNRVLSEFQIFLTFASFGIYTFGVREISKIRDNKEAVSKLFTNLFVITFITNTVVMVVYIIYSLYISTGVTRGIYLLMVIQIVGNIFYIEFINEAFENYKFITIKTAIIKLFYLAAMFAFVKQPSDILVYSAIICLTVFANNIVSFIYIKQKIKFNFSKLEFKKYLIPMFYLLIITNVELLYSQLDRVMLGYFDSDISVTKYYIPFFIVSTLAAIPYSIIMVSIPRLSYMVKNSSKEEYTNLLNQIISALFFVIVPMCLGVFILSKEIILIYAGKKYITIYPVLMVASIARIITTMESVMTHLIMYPNGKEKNVAKFCFFYGIINLFMNILLIVMGRFSPITAMLTTAIADLLFTSTELVYIKRKLDIKVKLLNNNKRYFFLSTTFIPIKLLLDKITLPFVINIVVDIIICSSIYFIALLIMRDNNLLIAMDKILKKIKRGL